MKSFLFFIILLAASNVFAQKSICQRGHISRTPLMYGCQTENNTGHHPFCHRTPDTKANVPVKKNGFILPAQTVTIDSLFYWALDIQTNLWVPDYKYVVAETDENGNATLEYGKRWDGNTWLNDEKTTYSYDVFDNPIGYTWQIWNGADWDNNQKGTSTYDANNNMLTEQVQEWDGSNWENTFIITYAYNQSGLQTLYVHQYWNGDDWENLWQKVYTYDAKGNLTNELHQDWNLDHWENAGENTFVYGDNNLLQSSHTQVDNGAELVYTETTYTYNPENKLISENSHSWGNSWSSYHQSLYTYDANKNLINILQQVKNGEIYENASQTNYTYDGSGNQASILRQDWKENTWVNLDLERMQYDENDSLTNHSYRYWDSDGISIMDGDSSAYYYHEVVSGLHEKDQKNENISIYPNPASSIINVTASGTIKKIKIQDMQGRLVKPVSIISTAQQTKIDISGYPKGTYLLTITSSRGRESKKLLIR